MKRFFPGTNTLADRKRFAIFHACTLVVAPIIGALFMFFIVSFNPFNNMGRWALISLFCWNLIGSIRFHDDTFDEGGFIASRMVVFICLFAFPFIYLYNLWCLFKKENGEK